MALLALKGEGMAHLRVSKPKGLSKLRVGASRPDWSHNSTQLVTSPFTLFTTHNTLLTKATLKTDCLRQLGGGRRNRSPKVLVCKGLNPMNLIIVTMLLALGYAAMGTYVPDVVNVAVFLTASHLALAILFIICEALSKSFGGRRTR